MDEVFIGTIVASTLRVSVPLILCALAGVLCERSGVIDLGLEGKMLLTAFATAAVGVTTGSLLLALAAAVAVGMALSMLHGYACVTHRGDQVVLGIAWFAQGGQTPPVPESVRLGAWFSGAGEGKPIWRPDSSTQLNST